MLSYIGKIIAITAGSSNTIFTSDKIFSILRGLSVVIVFIFLFSYLYYRFFGKGSFLKRIFFWTMVSLGILVIAKFIIFHFYKGYIPDRLLFYAVPSPKAVSIRLFLIPVFVFTTFLFLLEKIKKFSPLIFLLTLWLVFIIFSLSTAMIREGSYSIYEPFTRVHWEYTGNLSLIKNPSSFLHDYDRLNLQLAEHSKTHPPGYTIILYILQKTFRVDFLWLAILVVITGGLFVFPVYYFLREFFTEEQVKQGLPLLIFFPNIVLMGVTSMDFVFMFLVWLALVFLFIGWKRCVGLAFLGGMVTAYAFFSNFLLVLLGPLFLYLFYLAWINRGKKAVFSLTVSILGFILFFVIINFFTGYSIINNFFVAQKAQNHAVESNFSSLWIYLTYFIMNITAFVIYLGLPNLIIFFIQKTKRLIYSQINHFGIYLVLFFSFIGIFQGETERIWLFLTPLFLIPIIDRINNYDVKTTQALSALLVFQVIIIHTLFYTYW